MKKEYVQPIMSGEQFVPNEYVTVCYKIRCRTPNDNDRFRYLYEDTNGDGKLDAGDKELYSSWLGFYGCNEWHKGVIQDEPPTANGFVTYDRYNRFYDVASYPVLYWSEDLGTAIDYHSMIPGKENYESNPNAS